MRRSSNRIARQSLGRIFFVPLLLAAASLAGLILGLTGEGVRDWLSWLCLFLPCAVLAYHWLRRG